MFIVYKMNGFEVVFLVFSIFIQLVFLIMLYNRLGLWYSILKSFNMVLALSHIWHIVFSEVLACSLCTDCNQGIVLGWLSCFDFSHEFLFNTYEFTVAIEVLILTGLQLGFVRRLKIIQIVLLVSQIIIALCLSLLPYELVISYVLIFNIISLLLSSLVVLDDLVDIWENKYQVLN